MYSQIPTEAKTTVNHDTPRPMNKGARLRRVPDSSEVRNAGFDIDEPYAPGVGVSVIVLGRATRANAGSPPIGVVWAAASRSGVCVSGCSTISRWPGTGAL